MGRRGLVVLLILGFTLLTAARVAAFELGVDATTSLTLRVVTGPLGLALIVYAALRWKQQPPPAAPLSKE